MFNYLVTLSTHAWMINVLKDEQNVISFPTLLQLSFNSIKQLIGVLPLYISYMLIFMLNFENIKLHEKKFYKWIVMCDMIFVVHVNFE
jgi:hypothetical protein